MTARTAQHRGAQDDPWMTTDEAAAYAKCSTATIKTQAKLERLRGTKLGGTKRSEWRFRRSWIDAWLEGGQLPRGAA